MLTRRHAILNMLALAPAVKATQLLQTQPARTLSIFNARYSLLYRGATAGRARLSLAPFGDQWQLRLQNEASGLFKLFSRYIDSEEISRFSLGDEGRIWPRFYKLDRPGQKSGRKLLRIVFHDGSVEVARDIGEPKTYDMPDGGAWDRLSMLLSVPEMVQERSAGDLTLNIVNRNGPTLRRLELLGEKTLSTRAGSFDTLHLRYHNGKRTAEYWIASAEGGIPIKIVYGEDGSEDATLNLSSLSR